MIRTVWSVDTVTGGDKVLVRPSQMGWTRALNGTGQPGSATFRLGDSQVAELANRVTLRARSRTLVVEEGGVILYAGRINRRPIYRRATQELTVEHEDVWAFFRERYVLNDRSWNFPQNSTVEHRNFGMGTIARRLVRDMVNTEPKDMYKLPITFAADNPGLSTRVYEGGKLIRLDDALNELLESGNCPDIDFRPYWSESGQLRYEMQVGALSTNTLSWHIGTTQSSAQDALTDHVVMEDDSRLATSVFVLGEGSGDWVKSRVARETRNLPAVETQVSAKRENDLSNLLDTANEALRMGRNLTEQHRFTMRSGGTPGVQDLQLGTTARIYSKGDPWIPDGWASTRLVQFSGGLTDSIELDFQPIEEAA